MAKSFIVSFKELGYTTAPNKKIDAAMSADALRNVSGIFDDLGYDTAGMYGMGLCDAKNIDYVSGMIESKLLGVPTDINVRLTIVEIGIKINLLY